MLYKSTPIKDLIIYQPKVFSDSRGHFYESFNQRVFEGETGIRLNFVQDNQSKSSFGTLRGLHFQKGDAAQAKLVSVLSGKVLDVVVDLRPDSPTFKQSHSVELSAENKTHLFVPRGFAHGFVVLTETAEFFYKCDNYYNPSADAGIYYGDEDLNIDWIVPREKLILSEKDKNLPTLKDYLKTL